MVTAVLAEASPLSAPSGTEGKGVWRSCLIEADVQGSSGFYSAEVLMRDGPSAFPAGTHVYFDHPTSDEEEERPERSVRDLAGYLADPARFEEGPDGRGLFARIQFTPKARDHIHTLAPVVGLSIRASGEIDETPQGRIVRSIGEGLSVDVVTRAGAGGRLVTMTESAAPESSPAEQKAAPATTPNSTTDIPSTSGPGGLLSEVASMRTTLADQIEQLSVETARVTHELKESQRLIKKLSEENKVIRESITSIDDRQGTFDQQIAESEQVGEVAGHLIEAGLPKASMVRIAKSYRAGEDIHAKIQTEKEYAKKLLRESERSDLTRPETSSLGLTESALSADISSVSNEDISEMDAVLSGKLY